MKQYYYADGDQQKGPFSLEDLQKKHITPDTYIWYEGLSDWTPAGQLSEFDTFFASPPKTEQAPPTMHSDAPPTTTQQEYFNADRYQASTPERRRPRQMIDGQKPKTWLIEAILTTVICCIPTGIAAIIFASRVESNWTAGNLAEAEKASANAKLWTMISLVAGILFWIASFFLGLIGSL